MKTKIILPLLAVLCIYMTACQKSADMGPMPTSFVGDSTYLDKMYVLYDDGSGIDTQEIGTVHYDNQKRIVMLADSGVTSAGLEHYQTYYYFYNGTDTLPFKSVNILTESPGYLDTITVFHYYDALQRNLRDSSIANFISFGGNYSYREVTTFSYAPGRMYGYSERTSPYPPNFLEYTKDTAVTDVNGNITSNKKYTFNGTNYELIVTSDFTYDNRKSPFAKLNLHKAHKKFPSGETFLLEYISFNNRLTQYETSTGYIYDPTYSYTYNAAGYPVKVITTDGSEDITLFKYRTL